MACRVILVNPFGWRKYAWSICLDKRRTKMKINRVFMLCLLFIVGSFFAPLSYAEDEDVDIDELKKSAPRVFLDCRRCDHDYIRTEIPFVNYVRHREEADVHILVTTQRTGSGGWEYTMAFMGKEDYEDIQEVLKYVTDRTDTRDDERRGLVRILKMGLAPYVSRTPIANYISILFEEELRPTAVEDKWNFWVFYVSINGSLSGEKSRNYTSLRGSLSASRVTPDVRIRMGLSGNFNRSNFTIEDDDTSTTISSYSDRKSFSSLFVKSISDHWSVGGWLSASTSTYSNIDLSISAVPAIEYNLFPYSQSTRRQLRFLYRIGYRFVDYGEETIYDKMSEYLLYQSLSVTFAAKEPWGNMSASLRGSHYFHDFKKNRLEINGYVSLRLFRGLSLNMSAGFSAIHDQLSLPRRGASLEDTLLRRKVLATSYDYGASIGFSFTFGSVFSNVVNPRFGG